MPSEEGGDPSIKQIQLTGDAAALMGKGNDTGETRSRRRGGSKGGASKTHKILRVDSVTKEGHKEGGGATSPGTMVQLAASHIPADPSARAPVGNATPLTQKAAPVAAAYGGAATANNAPVKVVLEAAKKKQPSVVLAPATPQARIAATTGGGAVARATTRKTRKIKMSMRGLTKKIKRARSIRQTATDTTLEQIKKELHKAGLIKAQSNAPEPILRQMYADFMTLKTRAL